MSNKPKRRWFQFSLKTLLAAVTLTAIGLGWWAHRQYCLSQAKDHDLQVVILEAEAWGVGFYSGIASDEESAKRQAKAAEYQLLADVQKKRAAKYHAAVWRPWLRFGTAP